MEYKYLVMVTSDNHNKYYEMIPEGSSFTVKYGRVGANPQVRSYSEYEFDRKYNENIVLEHLNDEFEKEHAEDEYKFVWMND